MLSASELFLSSPAFGDGPEGTTSNGATSLVGPFDGAMVSPEWMRCDAERPAATLGDVMSDVMGDEHEGDAVLCERQQSLDPLAEMLPFSTDAFDGCGAALLPESIPEFALPSVREPCESMSADVYVHGVAAWSHEVAGESQGVPQTRGSTDESPNLAADVDSNAVTCSSAVDGVVHGARGGSSLGERVPVAESSRDGDRLSSRSFLLRNFRAALPPPAIPALPPLRVPPTTLRFFPTLPSPFHSPLHLSSLLLSPPALPTLAPILVVAPPPLAVRTLFGFRFPLPALPGGAPAPVGEVGGGDSRLREERARVVRDVRDGGRSGFRIRRGGARDSRITRESKLRRES
ncbi:unnamed protein product [Closterium sp. NIES-53]